MRSYAVILSRPARKDLQRLQPAVMRRIFVKIEQLAQQPRPAGCRKLHNEEKAWRIRIGDFRVLYEIDDTKKIVDVVAVRHRREAYR